MNARTYSRQQAINFLYDLGYAAHLVEAHLDDVAVSRSARGLDPALVTSEDLGNIAGALDVADEEGCPRHGSPIVAEHQFRSFTGRRAWATEYECGCTETDDGPLARR